jgi:hypothetical protein
VAIVRTVVSEEHIISIFIVKRINELRTTLTITVIWSTQRKNAVLQSIVHANVFHSSLTLPIQMVEKTYCSETSVVAKSTRRHITENGIFLRSREVHKRFAKFPSTESNEKQLSGQLAPISRHWRTWSVGPVALKVAHFRAG